MRALAVTYCHFYFHCFYGAFLLA